MGSVVLLLHGKEKGKGEAWGKVAPTGITRKETGSEKKGSIRGRVD